MREVCAGRVTGASSAALLTLLFASTAFGATLRDSPQAEALARDGYVIVAERDTARGEARLLVAIEGEMQAEQPDPQRLRVSIWKFTKSDPPALLHRTEPVSATRVGQFSLRATGCGTKGPAAIIELIDETPDEAKKTLLVLNLEGSPRVIFSETVLVADRDASLANLSLLPRPLGLAIEESGGALQALVLRHAPTLVPLVAPDGRRVELAVGHRETRFVCREGAFAEAGVRYVDALATGSRPAGPAGDGALTTGLHPAAQARLKLAGAGGRVLRLVPGCADSAAHWREAGEVRSLTLELPGQPSVQLELDAKVLSSSPAVAAAGMVPLPGATYGRQLLLVFNRPQTSLEVVVREADAAGGCLSELLLAP